MSQSHVKTHSIRVSGKLVSNVSSLQELKVRELEIYYWDDLFLCENINKSLALLCY